MQFAHHSSSGPRCAYCHLPVSAYHVVSNPWLSRSAKQPLISRATQAHLEATAANAAPAAQQDEGLPLASNGKYELQSDGAQRKSKYLSYQEYVELAQQQQAAVEPAPAAHAATEQQSSAHTEPAEAKRRIPWNKGRRHSAVTIAKIRERSILASQRPEVRAKYDAWNQARVGVSLPEQHKAQIRRGTLEARAERTLRIASPEELSERRAHKSTISRSLWQDPEYAERTKAAMRAKGKEKKDRGHLEVESQEGSSSGSASSSSAARTRRRTKVTAEGSDGEQQQQGASRQVKQRKPTQKELAAAAAEQQQQLQQQLTRLLQTQQLILTTERTVQQLHANLAAFENNPQSYAVASETMQRAQAHLAQARAQVQQLQQHLDDFGVKWDASTGQITHIASGLTAQLQQQKLEQRSQRNADTGSPGSKHDGVPRSKRGRPAGSSSSKRNSSSAEPPDLAPDIVRSQRRAAAVVSPPAAAGSRRVSNRNPAAAAAEAAEAGGSRSSTGSWPAVAPQLTEAGSSGGGLNGHGKHVSNVNGHSNGYSSGVDGSKYVAVQLQSAEEAED